MHTGVYPDGVIRLFRADSAYLPCKSVHEQYHVTGRVSWTDNDMLHYDSPTFARYLLRNNRYAELFATELSEANTPINFKTHFHYLISKPAKDFINLFIKNAGFKDGYAGFIFSLFSALTWSKAFLKYKSQK